MADIAAPPPVTHWLAERAAGMTSTSLPDAAVTLARQCILDWFAVTLPGAGEPAVQILRDDLLADRAASVASLVGSPEGTSAMNAAFINGTASHALDFDDVNLAILGHPTVAVLPGLLALAEEIGATPNDVITAFVAGYEVACRTGTLMSPSHYGHGFHATATVGSIGSAAACARLLGLDARTTATSFGIAATMASGLKSMFGTMCKPMHAGRAAQNGLQAARLAARGFTSRPEASMSRRDLRRRSPNPIRLRPAEPPPDPPTATSLQVSRRLLPHALVDRGGSGAASAASRFVQRRSVDPDPRFAGNRPGMQHRKARDRTLRPSFRFA